MQITNLRTNHFENPVGFQVSPLSLSWITEDTNRGCQGENRTGFPVCQDRMGQ